MKNLQKFFHALFMMMMISEAMHLLSHFSFTRTYLGTITIDSRTVLLNRYNDDIRYRENNVMRKCVWIRLDIMR